MGSGFSHLIPSCLHHREDHHYPSPPPPEVPLTPLDETLGHSFCYVRSSARFLSPTSSARFISPSQSLRFDDLVSSSHRSDPTGFRVISGASVSANAATSRTLLNLDSIAADDELSVYGSSSIANGFDCTASFSALPLQPVPRGESSGFFLSGPIERAGPLSGPLDPNSYDSGRVPFSAPLGGTTTEKKKKKRKKSLAGVKKALYGSFSEKKRPWVVPVSRKDAGDGVAGSGDGEKEERDREREERESGGNVQWALGKAGEDRVHVVVSEEHGWLFVGIYDGFNGPDAPEFLMGHLYRAVFKELKGLFWDDDGEDYGGSGNTCCRSVDGMIQGEIADNGVVEDRGSVKRVTFQSEVKESRRKLWEFLAENDPEDGLDLSGSNRFAFSVDDAVSVSNAASSIKKRSLLLSKLKQGLGRSKDRNGRRLFQWRFGVEDKDKVDNEGRNEETVCRNARRRKSGPVDHELVLRALAKALEKTENAFLDLTDKVTDQYPELALMGSCLLVALMRDEDVYVINLGDSRAIVAQSGAEEGGFNGGSMEEGGSSAEAITEEHTDGGEKPKDKADEFTGHTMKKLTALQLSTDHSTSIEEEVLRIKREHPDDNQCIVNDRVKGRLKVTRAFGAGSLKQPKFNDSLLEMFRNEFIGNAPYISSVPSLHHHTLGPRDQFLILSSDGLYQYLSNEEVVSYVERFMERFPDGDPAQHLIEELLNRAAKKAGMDFHDLLDIPQGDRRKFHDDVTVMVISLEGRIWKSSGKYP